MGGIINDPFKEQDLSFIDSPIENILGHTENLPIILFLSILDLWQAQYCIRGYSNSEIVSLLSSDDALVEWDDFKSIYKAPIIQLKISTTFCIRVRQKWDDSHLYRCSTKP